MAISNPTWTDALKQRTSTEDALAILSVAGLFSIAPTGATMSTITGLKRASLSDVLSGKTKKSSRHAHLQILDQLAKATVEWQRALGGTDPLDEGWLVNGVVHTSRGKKRPMDVLREPELAREALEQVEAALA